MLAVLEKLLDQIEGDNAPTAEQAFALYDAMRDVGFSQPALED